MTKSKCKLFLRICKLNRIKTFLPTSPAILFYTRRVNSNSNSTHFPLLLFLLHFTLLQSQIRVIMRNITLEILKAIAVLLVLLPVVDLVDQHRIGGEVQGKRKETQQSQVVGIGPGVILHTGESPHRVLLDNNHTRIRTEDVGSTRRTTSGNWDSLSPTRSDITASVPNSREHFQKHSFALQVFPSSMSSSASSSLSSSSSALAVAPTSVVDKRYYSPSSSLSSSSSYIKSSSRTITERHVHVMAPMTTSTTTASGGGGGGAKRDPNNKGSNHLASFAVEPPLPLASSTRVTGPYFESNKTTIHISAKAGQTVILDCAVILLQGRTVSWLKRGKDSVQLLTVGNTTYNSDSRLGLRFRYPNNWRLGIDLVNKGDEGEYHCQLSTHPPKVLIYHLKVIAPMVVIVDDNGHTVTERHYKVDSSLHLTCRASHVDKFVDKVVWLKGDRPLPGGDSRIKVKLTKNTGTGESTAFLSVLSVRKGDSGNYSCQVSSLAKSTITVHVLNGELPAAVQHESSSNRLDTPTTITLATVALLMSASTTLFIACPQFTSSSSTILLTALFAIAIFTCSC